MQTIYLEFQHEPGNLAANGSDIVFYIDGRWSAETTREKIYERVEYLRSLRGSKYKKQLFVGYTHSQQPFYNGSGGAIRTMLDRNPPAWHEAKNGVNGYNVDCRLCIYKGRPCDKHAKTTTV